MPRKRGKAAAASEAVEKPVRRSHRASRARKSPTPDWEGSGEEEEVVSKPKRRGKQVTEDEDESDDSSQEEVAPVRRRRGRPSTVSVSESSDTAGGRKIRLRRTKAEPEMTPVAEQAAEEEPPPRRSRRTRQTRRGRSESGSEERAAAAADSGSPGEESRKKLAGRAANMSPIATKLSRTPSGHWLVCPSTTEPEEDDDDDEDQPLSKPSPEAQEQPASTTVDDSPPNVAVESIASEVTPSQPSPEPESPQVTQSKTPSSEETSPVTEVKATSKVHEPSPPTLQREEVCEQQESSDLPPPVLSSRADAKPEEDSSSSSSSSSGSSSSDESDTGSDEQANSASEASQPLPQEIAKSKPIAETTKPVESEPVVPVAEPDAAESEDIQEAQKAAQAILDITAESEAPPEESVGCAVVVVQEEVAQSPIMDVTPEKEDSIPEKTEMKQSEEKEIKEKCVEKEIEEQRVEKEQKEESAAQEIKAKIVEKEVEEKVIEQKAKIATEVEKSPEKHVQQEKITKVTPTKIEAVSDTKEPEQEKEKKNENVTTETEEKVKSPVSKKQDIHKPASEEPEKIVSSVDSSNAKCETVAAIEVAPEDKPMPAEKTDESPAVSTDAKPTTEEVSDTKEKEAASKDSSPELMDTVVAPVEVVETAKEIVSDDDEENESSDEVTAGKRQSEEARREQAKKRQHSRQLRSRDDSPSRRDREDSRKNRREEHSRQDKGSESRSTRDTRESRRKDRSGSPHRSERSSERSKEVSASTEKQLDTNKENTERARDTPRSRDKSNDDRKEITLKRTSSPVRVEKPRSKESSRKSPSPSKPTTKPKRLEKLCLKRTRMDSVDDSATTPKTEGEGEKSAECATPTTLAKKRRWGSSQARTANKTPAVAISTEILKNIIPDAKPVPEDEVKQLLEEQEVKRESRGAEALEMLRQVDGDMEVTSLTDMTPMMPAAPVDPPAPPVVETEVLRGRTVRKISILQDDVRALQKSPSPPRHAPTSILHITNLVRPFTLPQLKELLTRTGNIIEGSFWIDKIKSKCFAEFSTEEEARNTRHALHGVRWPISNPKRLNVDYASRETLEKVLSQAEEEITTQKPEVQRVERVVTSNGTAPAGPHAQAGEWTGAGPKREASRERERGGRDGEFKTKPFQTAADVEDRHGRRIKVDAPVREWDLHKVDQSDPHDRNRRNFEEHEKDFEDRRMRKRSHSPSPVRRVKKKSEEGAAKLLDDLFRKTKTTPCIYWLPLSPEQIAEKEEMRRQHMAEHERRMAEMKRSEEHRMMRMGHSKQFNSGSRRRERSPEPRRGGGSKPSSGGRPRRSSRSASPKK